MKKYKSFLLLNIALFFFGWFTFALGMKNLSISCEDLVGAQWFAIVAMIIGLWTAVRAVYDFWKTLP